VAGAATFTPTQVRPATTDSANPISGAPLDRIAPRVVANGVDKKVI